jgi:hypothetical protein
MQTNEPKQMRTSTKQAQMSATERNQGQMKAKWMGTNEWRDKCERRPNEGPNATKGEGGHERAW